MKVQELLPADDGRHSVALFSFSTNSHISATSPRFSNIVDSLAIDLIRTIVAHALCLVLIAEWQARHRQSLPRTFPNFQQSPFHIAVTLTSLFGPFGVRL